jgi:DNA invertase Pin-like site-specific DNA recombinase
MSDNTIRAGLYGRISDDRDGEESGVKRQLADGRDLVQRRGGTVVMEQSDNDISALSGKKRPGYDAIMTAAKAGHITHIVVWQTSRLWRNRRERAEGIEQLRAASVSVLAVKGPDLDMSTAYGRGMAGLLGEFDTMESEVKSERIRRKAEELADEGKIANGGPRPFGYRRIYAGEGTRRKIVRDDIEPDEADIVRDCARRLLAGESKRSIVTSLNDRGIPTSTGGRWSMQGLRAMMRSGRIAGLREHKDQVRSKAVWPAIITQEEHLLLRALLDSDERPPGSRVRTHYLTGIVYCGRCAEKNMRMGVVPQHGKLKYRCPPKPEGGCNGRIIPLAGLEELIDAYMVARLLDPTTLRSLTARQAGDDRQTGDVLTKIEGIDRRIALLKAAMEDGPEEDIPEVMSTVRALSKRRDAAREELGRLALAPDLAQLDFVALAAGWQSLHLDQKQMLMRLFIERILIGPGRPGPREFDAGRVDIVPIRRWPTTPSDPAQAQEDAPYAPGESMT